VTWAGESPLSCSCGVQFAVECFRELYLASVQVLTKHFNHKQIYAVQPPPARVRKATLQLHAWSPSKADIIVKQARIYLEAS